MLRTLYSFLIDVVFIFMFPKLKHKYTEGFDERQGAPSYEKLALLNNKKPLWIHGVSVGEVQAAISIIKTARDEGYEGPIVLSTTTETGKAMASRIGDSLFDLHIYYPWDRAKFVSSTLDRVNPWAFVTMETELWPNMLWELKDRQIPAFLSNGRISNRTWARLGTTLGLKVGKKFYNLFTELCLREKEDQNRLIKMGIPESKLHVVGDTKIDALLSRKDLAKSESLKKSLSTYNRSIFIAGSTHMGECEELFEAFAILRNEVPNARLLIAPRHPEKAELVFNVFCNHYKTTRTSEDNPDWDVMVVDKIGVLYNLYSLAIGAFVGGSFVDKGGQNILEPVSWGVPVQYGPHMEDFSKASKEFIALGIATQVCDGKELAEVWKSIAANPNREKYENISRNYFDKESGASKRTWKILASYYI